MLHPPYWGLMTRWLSGFVLNVVKFPIGWVERRSTYRKNEKRFQGRLTVGHHALNVAQCRFESCPWNVHPCGLVVGRLRDMEKITGSIPVRGIGGYRLWVVLGT